MPWWGWITIGAILLVAEMTIVDVGFYLVFLGAAAFSVGVIVFLGVPMPFWLQWIVFAALSIASLVIFRQRLYQKMRPPPDMRIREGVEGGRATSTTAIDPGGTGAVSMQGATWTGRNVGSLPIPIGGDCLVMRTEGLVLELILESEGDA